MADIASFTRDDVEQIKKIIQSGVGVNEKNCFGWSALHLAVFYNYKNVLQFLIKEGGDLNIKNKYQEVPLHTAAIYDSIECMQLLLEAGANINAMDNNGDTPLHLAARHRSKESIKLLLEWGADATIKNKGRTFLDCIPTESLRKEIEEYVNTLSTQDIKEPSL